MAIRVTNDYLLAQTVADINRNLKLLQDIQLKLTTGNKINKPSDDPVGTFQSIILKSDIAATNQHQVNINFGRGRLNATIQALSEVDNLLLVIQGLTAEVINDPSSVTRGVIASEIDGLLNDLFIKANAKYLGKYLFGGHETLTAPYTLQRSDDGLITGVTRNPAGIDDKIFHTIADGLNVEVNISGSAPFMPNGENGALNIFQTVINIRDFIRGDNLSGATQALTELGRAFENVVTQTTVAGQRLQRLESTENTNDALQIGKQENLSQILNVDFVQAISDLNYQSFIYQSSLNVGARILPPSLLDFI